MTKDELKDELKNRISLALKDPMLQQGFEIICKEIAELKEVNADLKQSLDWANERESEDVNRIAELEKENAELKERNGELAGQKASLKRWLGEAKGIIKKLVEGIRIISDPKVCMTDVDVFVSEAEKVIKER